MGLPLHYLTCKIIWGKRRTVLRWGNSCYLWDKKWRLYFFWNHLNVFAAFRIWNLFGRGIVCLRGGVRRVSTGHTDCTSGVAVPGSAVDEFATTSPSLCRLGAQSERDYLLGACASGSLRVMARPRPGPSDWGLSSLLHSHPPGQGQYPFLTLLINHLKKRLFILQQPGWTCSTNSTYVFNRLNLTLSLRQNIHTRKKLIYKATLKNQDSILNKQPLFLQKKKNQDSMVLVEG